MVKVLLTGGSGFIAVNVFETLLQRGHKVVFTVRSHEKGKSLLNLHPNVPPTTLSYTIVEDIAKEGAFDSAVKSDPPFDAVIHTASPFFIGHSDPVKDFLDPAIKGTTGVLKAIKKYAPSVQQVVITSSYAAMMNQDHPPKVYNESCWNPVTMEQAISDASRTYHGSKTFAERAAWDFLSTEKPNFSLTTLCPPLVIGPLTPFMKSLDEINSSNHRIRDLVLGEYAGVTELPPWRMFCWADVRDVALAHVLSIEKPEAKGKRIFVTEGHFSQKMAIEVVRETHPELEAKLPSRECGDDLPERIWGIDNSRSKEILGLEYRGLKESVKDTVESVLRVAQSS